MNIPSARDQQKNWIEESVVVAAAVVAVVVVVVVVDNVDRSLVSVVADSSW